MSNRARRSLGKTSPARSSLPVNWGGKTSDSCGSRPMRGKRPRGGCGRRLRWLARNRDLNLAVSATAFTVITPRYSNSRRLSPPLSPPVRRDVPGSRLTNGGPPTSGIVSTEMCSRRILCRSASEIAPMATCPHLRATTHDDDRFPKNSLKRLHLSGGSNERKLR